jgi:hypothetical protein
MNEQQRKAFFQKAWEDIERVALGLVFDRKLAKGQQIDFVPNPESIQRLGLTFTAMIANMKRLEAMLRASGVPEETIRDYAARGAQIGIAALTERPPND